MRRSRAGTLTLDWSTTSAVIGPDRIVRLIPSTFDCLFILAEARGEPVSWEVLAQRMFGMVDVWPDSTQVLIRMVVCNLRKKLVGSGWRVETTRGVGYALKRERA